MKTLKKIALASSLALVSIGIAMAARVVYRQNLVSETALAYSKTYTLDMGNSLLSGSDIDNLSMQAVYSSATVSAVAFTDGVKSTVSFTVSQANFSQLIPLGSTNTLKVSSFSALSGTYGYNSLNVSSNTWLSSNTVDLILNGTVIDNGIEYAVGSSSTATATNIAAAIGALAGFNATSSGSTVSITCDRVGDFCNSYRLSSSSSGALTVTASTFIGGYNNAAFNLNGTLFTQGVDWTKQDTATGTIVNITNAINASANVNTVFSATTSADTGAISTITVTTKGTIGNNYTLTSATSSLTRGAANFVGGVNPGILDLAGVVLVSGTDFTAVTNASTTAKNISDAIQANSTLSAIISSTWAVVAVSSNGIVTATSTVVGSTTNYGAFTNKTSAISVTNNGFYGGAASNVGSGVISVTNHGLTNGLAVLFTKSAGTVPGGLTANVTYYAIRDDANTIRLSSGTTVPSTATVTITSVTGGGTFALTPLAISGTPAFKWQGSNDGSNWNDVNVSSVTMSSLAQASTTWDFGTVNYRYLRLNVVGPTTGGINLVVTGLGKSL